MRNNNRGLSCTGFGWEAVYWDAVKVSTQSAKINSVLHPELCPSLLSYLEQKKRKMPINRSLTPLGCGGGGGCCFDGLLIRLFSYKAEL